MVGKTIGRAIDAHQLPVYVERFGATRDEIFVTASTLRKEFGNGDFEKIPTGAIGLYTYYERLAQGLRHHGPPLHHGSGSRTSGGDPR